MKKAFAITLLAAGASHAGAQVLTIPALEPRLAFDETADLLYIPDDIADPLPDSGKEPMPRVAPRKATTLLFREQSSESHPGLPQWEPGEAADEHESSESRDQDEAADDWSEFSSSATESREFDSPQFDWPVTVAERDWRYLVIHHSATSGGSVEAIHREHRQRQDASGRPWLGIAYHFVIGNGSGMGDGETQSTFRWNQQLHGAHSGSIRYNGTGIGICVIGNFEQQSPSDAQTDAVARLVSQLAHRYDIPADRIIGHRQIRATACPGRHFPLEQIVRDSASQDSSRTSNE